MDAPKSTPRAVLDAILPQSIDCGFGVSVRPFTLATYAVLERIGSYILMPHQPDPMEVIRSLYVCCTDPRETAPIAREGGGEELDSRAVAWADRLPPGIVGTITDAVRMQIGRVRAAMPPPSEGRLKKAETAG